jgi:ammonia channel protein AmtB
MLAALTFLVLNIAWTGGTMAVTFFGLGAGKLLRVSVAAEKEGLDEHEFSPKMARVHFSPKSPSSPKAATEPSNRM